MILNHEFEIAAGPEAVWALLDDLDRVIPCMPGAIFTGFDGERALATVAVKVGPIATNFEGAAHFAARDRAAGTATIVAKGKDKRGQATANARITAQLMPVAANRTRVELSTDLDITGRLAQFGRGVIVDISNRLLAQFVTNLGEEIEGRTSRSDATTAMLNQSEIANGVDVSRAVGHAPSSGAAVSLGPLISGMAASRIREHGAALAAGALIGAAATLLLRRSTFTSLRADRTVLVVMWPVGSPGNPTG